MYRPSVLCRRHLVIFALFCGIASVRAAKSGWAQQAPAVARRGTDAFRRLAQDGTGESLAAAVTQEVKLTAADGAALQYFGYVVAISGNTAIIGAVSRAYIFVRNGPTWSPQQTLTSAIPDEDFASSVAISGNTAIVGATAAAGGKGVAYVYVRTGVTWALQGTDPLTASDGAAADQFGTSVAISGDTAVVGAPYKDNQRGQAYVFVRSGQTWAERAKLRTVGGDEGDGFGASVGISGETVIVGVPGDNVVGDTLEREGSAHVFLRNDTAWTEQGFLSADDTFGLGMSVSISGDAAVAGALNEAYVYDRTAGMWSPGQRLSPNPGEIFSQEGYGGAVAVSGQRAVVGSRDSDKGRGVALVFQRSNGTWTEEKKLIASDRLPLNGNTTTHHEFGGSVAMSGDQILVGAYGKQVGSNDFQGGAYVYQSPDADGDNLPDEWETDGVTIDGAFIDLPTMGADPQHKDIFVHVDWMAPSPSGHHHEPDPRAIRAVIDSFAAAPVGNPDGRNGINLHVDAGPLSIMKYITGGSQTWGVLSRAGQVPFKALVDSTDPPSVASTKLALVPSKQVHFTPAERATVFHYALYCEDVDIGYPGGASVGATSAPDFLVAYSALRTRIAEASMFMHEFGHNLGLDHGGGDEINHKPNYISVMNYRFQIIGTLRPDGRQRIIDYSRQVLPTLDETHLDEFVGINDPGGHLTFWNRTARPDVPAGSNKCLADDLYYRAFYPTDTLDWDCNGTPTFTSVSADLNGDGRCILPGPDSTLQTSPGGDDVVIGPSVFPGGGELDAFIASGPNRTCNTTAVGDDVQGHDVGFVQPALLKGSNDWAHPPTGLAYDGEGRIGTGANGTAGNARQAVESDQATALPHEVPYAELMAEIPTALLDEELVAPLDAVSFAPQAGGSPLQVTFNGSASTAVSGSIVSWDWSFGDGATGSGASVLHTYNAIGEYFASLTVTDSNGHVNLVPQLQHVVVLDPTIATVTPATTPTPIALPTPTVTPPPGSTPTRTATPTRTPTATRTPTSTPTPGVSLVVTTAADNGNNASPVAGSLRQAILTANATANLGGVADAISFDIPGAGVHTITPLTDLPAITDPVTIDGYTQPGASANTLVVGDNAVLLIELNGDNMGFVGLDLTGGHSTVRGLVVNHFDAFLTSSAIRIASSDNVVAGNFIGTNAAGTAAVQNILGVKIDSGADNVIGGATPADRNIVAGDAGNPQAVAPGTCVYIRTGQPGTRVQGNYIGTNAAGNAPLGAGVGIYSDLASTGMTIGGSTTTPGTGAGNVISGNTSHGISLNNFSRAGDVLVQGNIVGLTASGTAALGNGVGIFVADVPGTGALLIGGTASGTRNVISGNAVAGITNGASGLAVQGNFIGTDITGTVALGNNGEAGIVLSSPGSATVGGASAAARNVIAGNGRGLRIYGGVATVQGNFIGTTLDGVSPLANGVGVRVENDAIVTLGGTATGQGNVIAHSSRPGVVVRNTARVVILGNSLFDNGTDHSSTSYLGLDLNEDAVTNNDTCDPDAGPNGLQNYPVLATAVSSGAAGTAIVGTINSKASTAFRVELFASPVCGNLGKGEGKTFIGATTVTTAADCNGAVGATFQPAVAVGQFVTATATDPDQNTSEFSGCVQVTGTGPVSTSTPAATATTPAVTPTAAGSTSAATPAVTPSATLPAPTRTPAPENCYDCIDNDDDGAIDRDDTECPQRANGMQLGLSLPGKGAKAIAKCAKTLGKAGPKFSASRLKHLQKCVNAELVCVQQKPNDPACAAKAQKTCSKELGKAGGDAGKLRQAVLKACELPAIDLADLRSVAGVGYETELAVCAERGVATLTSAADVADCLVAQHECRVEDLLASEMPRAVELLELAGRDPSVELPCLVAGANGAAGDLGAAKGKLVVKCQKAIGKAGAKFASQKAKLTQKCLSAAYACVQVKTTDPKCRPKARATCTKQLAKLTAPGSGAVAKLAATITKGCTKAPLTLTDLLTDGGLGFAALGGECAALGVPSLDSLADVSTCLERRHTCRIEQMIETEMPRLEELLDVGP